MRKTSKRHHTIAKGILKNFCYSENKFWYYSKKRRDEGVCSRDIERKFVRRNYYSIIDRFGVFDDRLEADLLQRLDCRFSEIVAGIDKSIEKCIALRVDEETERFVKCFLYYHLKRSPDFNEAVFSKLDPERIIGQALEEYQRVVGPIPEAYLKRLSSDSAISDVINHARVRQTGKLSGLIMSRIAGMQLALAIAPEGTQFVIGSCATVRLEDVRPAELGDGNVEMWSPVTKKLMIGVYGKAALPLTRVAKLRLTKGQVRVINQQIFRLSTEVASASDALLQSLVTSKEYALRPHG